MIKNFLLSVFNIVLGFIELFTQQPAYKYGFAIILFTALIKLLLLPLYIKQTKSQAKMQEIQPKMQEIQNKYKNDPAKAQQELSKLYKEAGTNPLGGCLPLLIQMPIFFAMYAIIRELPLADISKEGHRFFFIDLSATGNYVLAILSGLSSYFSASIMMPKGDNPQAKTTNTTNTVMTIFSGFITLTVPAGLGVYWVANSLFTLLQNLLMKKLGLIGKSAKKNDGVEHSKDIVKEVSTDSLGSKGKKKGNK
ncbi:YidC/Oxa1 family membrane protein insertase [Clostridium thermarum]|uniref:YidC/Oxa1 family membrane protein insertase n=1 Tax=Clostridium thermarum TaxID=1716543 RepID=UPI0013D77EFA|nr:YidC/Oxa1 family membrane protein insertase [Clostridium thermarum]